MEAELSIIKKGKVEKKDFKAKNRS